MAISKQALLCAAMGVIIAGGAAPAMAQQSTMRVENLDRGAIAVKGEKGMLVSWRGAMAIQLGWKVSPRRTAGVGERPPLGTERTS